MRTDDLIAMLSTNVEPVDRRKLVRTFGAALAIGGAAALGVVVLGLGLRTDLTEAGAFVSLVLKLIFTIGVLGLAFDLSDPARPSGRRTQSAAHAARSAVRRDHGARRDQPRLCAAGLIGTA